MKFFTCITNFLFVLLFLCTAFTDKVNGQNPLTPAGVFNVFVEGNFTVYSSETEGSVAVGGNLIVNGGYGIAASTRTLPLYKVGDIPVGLVVNGGISLNGGLQVLNNTYMKIGNCASPDPLITYYKDNNNTFSPIRINKTSTSYGQSPTILLSAAANYWTPANPVSASNNPVCGTTGINFSTAFSSLRTNSTTLALCSGNTEVTNANGTIIPITNLPNQIKINLHSGVNVLNITGSDLSKVQDFILNNSPSASQILVINVAAVGAYNWSVPNINVPGDKSALRYILWNFPSTTVLTIQGAQIEGSVLAPNADVIKMGSSNIEGQFIAKSFSNIGGEMHDYPFNASLPSCAPMPVRLVKFTATPEGSAVRLAWETSWEYNSDYFVVERSNDAIEFGSLGRVLANGQTSQSQRYSFTDQLPSSQTAYYRLRMVDKDGSFDYSKLVAFLPDSDEPLLQLLENPTTNQVLRIQLRSWTVADLRLTNMQGQLVSFKGMAESNGTMTLRPDQTLPAGVYVLTARRGITHQQVRLVIL
ncbi:collagen-binding domain-containing protein [Spirosoma endophyticum]|uniref:Por secretion system C-terminal sorting domain-containing protein/choice-of-anchor A domain-containing protein n=1 Tax=Spirosoma endophyticum TaxID=662367 RepID=A0A1I1MLL7_9BACT|nr:collagen-binding domain-containing protein [Spirosoma endophyticum]SFC86025.1 Por secretion system C-terminal sorting domain-containing protein/choice-of-anchor A domain-containing protein [Spirosoma endophyticum]